MTKKPSKVKRKRDHKAEYAKRVARALAKGKTRQEARGHKKGEYRDRISKGAGMGLSRTQASGHPKKGELTVREAAEQLRDRVNRLSSAKFTELRESGVYTRQGFVHMMILAGMSEREAYTLWHSP